MSEPELSVQAFADLVEEQHNSLMGALNASGPEADLLRSFFSPEFIEEKDRETREYIQKLRDSKEP